MPRLSFWFEFASTYSYLSALRIEAMAAEKGVAIDWHPFLLGPIFRAQGWETSPFNIYPAKGRYMVRDIGRIAAARGLSFRMPETFPQNGLAAARLATVGARDGWVAPFVRAVYTAEFADGRDISDEAVLADLLADIGIDPTAAFAAAGSPEIKNRLRTETATAERLGIFGAPSFVTADGELYWGDDRLEAALADTVSGPSAN
ncbi:2-hydroxychromene-2-carboxylate isomerase [Pinisolibacter sp.]|uniref:2-hydroxychromene-2-carboxylate isomerase n=1 Tax=Pinisolibacter sp. TaxID=2172024 RepID=UPI002FDCD892